MEALTSDRDIAADPTLASLLERAPDDATRIELLIARARQLQPQHPQQAIGLRTPRPGTCRAAFLCQSHR